MQLLQAMEMLKLFADILIESLVLLFFHLRKNVYQTYKYEDLFAVNLGMQTSLRDLDFNFFE